MGGNSLMATQVATMLQKVLPIEIDLRKVFEGPTAAEVVEAERLALGDRERAVMAGISSNSSRRWTRSEGHRPMTRLTAIDQPVRLTSRDRNGP